MTAIKLNIFSGLRPRFSESLLPQNAATTAQNCDFAYGELRNTRDGMALSSMVNTPRSIYTDNGLTFYTWSSDVNAVRSPLVNDAYNRMYYTDGSAFRVARRDSMTINGGPPGTSYKVGVPAPAVKPTLAATMPTVNSTTHNFTFRFHYESAGQKYQEQAASVVDLGNSKWRLTPPAKETGTDPTPENAAPVLRITAVSKTDNSQTFDLYSNVTPTSGLYSLTLTNDTGSTTYTGTLSIAVKDAEKDTRAYVYTYRNIYGEEGPPSPASTITTGTTITVTVQATKSAAGGYANLSEIVVYRTPTGSNIADYFYVGSAPIAALADGAVVTFTDSVNASQLNEPISSANFYPPPDNLVGLMSLPNGILCAWRGNELWFSEAYKPWAWPPNYSKPLPHQIVGGIAHGSGAVITTLANPYLVSGVSPDSMTANKLNVTQAGVSKWSIASVDGAVVYASNDGLVTLVGGSASLDKSGQFFTREKWRSLYGAGLSTMNFSVWDGRLVVFSSINNFVPFMIRLDEADGTMTDLPGLVASCGFVSPVSDQFYFANGTTIYQFNGGSVQSAVWESREMVLPLPDNFGMAQAVVEGAWTIYVYAGGVLKHTKSVTTGVTNFRLPSGFKSDRWKIKITGTGRFRELRIARTAVELAKV